MLLEDRGPGGGNCPTTEYFNAIGQHLLDNPEYTKLYNDDMFRIIGRARSSFHLAVLNQSTSKRKSRYCVDKRSKFFLLDSRRNSLFRHAALIGHFAGHLLAFF